MKKYLLVFPLFLVICQISNAQIITNINNASCSSNGNVRLTIPNDSIYSFTYSGTKSGSVVGNYAELNAGVYNITATLSNGNVQTLNNVIIDHDNHIQMKNWYLSGNIPSTSVNWGASLNDPLMLNWDGITTDTLGCITQIILYERDISGNVPNFNLSNITTLILNLNNFTGTIPNFNLPKLEILYIRNNKLTGTIPNFNLPSLKQLSIRNNQLSGTIPNFNLPNLELIRLENNLLTGTIPNFNLLPNLQYLYLSQNQLVGNIPNFSQIPKLKSLFLGQNQLEGCIPNFSQQLECLYIDNNKLEGCIPNQLLNLTDGNFSQNPSLANTNISNFLSTGSGACFSNCNDVTINIQRINNTLSVNSNNLKPKYLWSNGATTSTIEVNAIGVYSVTITDCQTCSKFASVNIANISDVSISNADCYTKGKIKIPNVVNYSYSGTHSGNGIGDSIRLDAGLYTITATFPNNSSKVYSNVLVDHHDRIELEKWHQDFGLKYNTNINWATSLKNPLLSNWNGIISDGYGCVTEIVLSNFAIDGVPPNIDFPKLTRLELGNNEINARIPTLNCPKLKYLFLGSNQFFDTIPKINGDSLEIIELNFNNLTGKIPNLSLPNLKTFGFQYNFLIGGVTQMNTPKLEYFYGPNNQLNGKVDSLVFPNLKYLDFSYNKLKGNLPNFYTPKLENLYLYSNSLEGIIPALTVPYMGGLDLSYNNFSGCIPASFKKNSIYNYFPGYFYNNPNLNVDWYEYWYFNKGVCHDCDSIKIDIKQQGNTLVAVTNVTNAKYLWSNGNTTDNLENASSGTYSVTVTQIDGCQKSLTKTFNNIQKINLSYQIFNADCEKRGKLIVSHNNAGISSYQFTSSNQSGEVLKDTLELSAGIYKVTITLNDNTYDIKDSVYIDHEEHIFLKNWYLSGNIPPSSVNWGATLNDPLMMYWDGIIKDNYWSSTYCVNRVELYQRNISGTIPNFNFKKLTYIYLNGNQLNGAIPDFNLPSLTRLFLDFNNLSDTIPNFINCPIETLYLNNNQFSGKIPDFNNPFLRELQLNNNNLFGEIPSFSNCYSLSHIDLSNNNLSGKIPAFNQSGLRYLYLNNNNLIDTIPNFINTSLILLNVSHNGLSGKIPSAFPYIINSLYLNDNNLSGCIPHTLRLYYPFLGPANCNIQNNPNLVTQNWSDYWYNNVGACFPCEEITATFNVSGLVCNQTAKITVSTNALSPTFLWDNGSTTKTISALNTGQYSVTITQIGGCKVVKNYNLIENITLNTTTIDSTCTSPGKITLSTFINASVHSYSFSGASSGSGLGSTINNLATGIYNITATLSNTCKIEKNNVVINKNVVYLNPNLGNDTTILLGQAVTLTSANATSYRWNTGATTQNITVSPTVTTTYSITVTSSTGCMTVEEKIVNIIVLDNGLYFKDPIIKNNKLQVKLWLKPNYTFSIGSNNLRFNYNNTAVNNPQIVSEEFPSPYFSSTTTTGSSPNLGFLSLNTVYNGNVNENIFPISTDGTTLATVEFNIVNANLNAELSWRIGSNPKTTIVDDDKVTPFLNFSAYNLSIPLKNVNLGKDTLLDCSIQSLTLSANLGNSFLWNTGETTQSITVSPSNTTTYSVTATNVATSSDEIIISRNNCYPTIKAKVFLENTDVNTGLMSDELRNLSNFPTADPYRLNQFNTKFIHVNNPQNQVVAPSVMALSNNDKVIDWMFLELRKGTALTTNVMATKAVLIQKDGNLVDVNGNLTISFEQLPIDNYYLAIKHRNHLGLRTLNPYFLSNTPNFFNFTNSNQNVFTTSSLKKLNNTTFTMLGGDSNSDGSIDAFDSIEWESYNGLNNDYNLNADYNFDGSVDAFDSIIWELNNGVYEEIY